MRTLIIWLWYENLKNTLIHINVLSIWKYKNSIKLYFHHIFIHLKQEHETYFHVLVFLKMYLKCILKHAIIQYHAMKSNIFLLLIIKVKHIHEFKVLILSLWILSIKKNKNSLIGIRYHAFTPIKLSHWI
jgi:hypothetical protein